MAGVTSTVVACVQLAPAIADPDANRALAERGIRDALEGGANVIVLPELMTTGYHLRPDEAVRVGETPEGASLAGWARALGGSDAVVVGGYAERGDDGLLYNSAALVDAEGTVASYRKTHLWDREPAIFARGAASPPVVDTRWGRIGVAVCYDLFFPELTRGLALRGAELLAVPTNSPWSGPREVGAAPVLEGIGHTIARAAAYQNRVYIAVCDRHGDERDNAWTSRSSIIDPEGGFRAGPAAYREELLLAECDLAQARRKRWDGTVNDVFADRRPDLYADVVSGGPGAA